MEEFKTLILFVCKILIWFKICSVPAKIYLCAFFTTVRNVTSHNVESKAHAGRESETSKKERGEGEY